MAGKNVLIALTILALLLPVTALLWGGDSQASKEVWPDTMYGSEDWRAFEGTHISFSMDMKNGELRDVSTEHEMIMEKIALSTPMPFKMSLNNLSFHFSSPSCELSVNDFSSPSIVYRAKTQCSLSVVVNSDLSIERDGNGVSIKDGVVLVSLVSDGHMDIYRNRIDVSLEDGGSLLIRFSNTGSDERNSTLNDAVYVHRLGAEAYLKAGEFSSVSYNNISIKPIKIENKKMVFSVGSNESSGGSVFLHLSSVNLTNITVLLDGRMIKKGSYYDALFSTGDSAVWNCTEMNGGLGIAVYIPHFSSHILTIEESQETAATPTTPVPSSTSPTLPIISALLISALAAIALIGRKRRGIW